MFGKVVNLWSDMFHQTYEQVEEDIVEDLELCREIEKYVAQLEKLKDIYSQIEEQYEETGTKLVKYDLVLTAMHCNLLRMS